MLRIVVLRDALVEPGAKLGQRRGQPLQRLAAERQQPHRRDGLDGGGRGASAQRRHLAEILARAERRHVRALAVRRSADTHAAFFNQIQRPGGVALTVDEFASVDDHWLELGEHHADDGFGRQPRERREACGRTPAAGVLELQLEVGADVGVGVDEGPEVAGIEPQRQHVACWRARWTGAPPSRSSTSPKLSPARSTFSGISSPVAPRLTTRARPDTRT